MKKEIEVLARAVIENKRKFLVCRKLKKRYYFFPGGHLEFGESAKEALIREIKEELGITIKRCTFIGGSEHTFIEEGKKHHEINLAFEVSVGKISTDSQENHLRFYWIDKNKELYNISSNPAILLKALKDRIEDIENYE